ncbi:MAG: DUF721 domain-containing protein [Bacteroidaceae bacterium]|nr:DUF721 domain-containing protein [Bacteroidaceae bacterium]
MKKRNAEHIGEVIHQFLRQEGLETPYNEYRLVQAWPEVMGHAIEQYTADVQIRNRALYVKLRSSVLRHELMMNRHILVHRLNEYVGAQVIDNIIFC